MTDLTRLDDDLLDDDVPPGGMPGTVRGARLIALVSAAVGVVLIAVTLALGKNASLGWVALGYLPTFALATLSATFGRAGERVRLCAVALAAIGGLSAFSGILTGLPPGAVGIVAGGATVGMLTRPSARAWFAR
ncbi:hypothetical protein [Nocardia thailandica]|uniref:hypothetical protein n=1 Tax=Nocardia thailandica TaxID=257275 RepID=UPI0002DB9696|nr:hypothetical protein [Nocardia thailandica]